MGIIVFIDLLNSSQHKEIYARLLRHFASMVYWWCTVNGSLISNVISNCFSSVQNFLCHFGKINWSICVSLCVFLSQSWLFGLELSALRKLRIGSHRIGSHRILLLFTTVCNPLLYATSVRSFSQELSWESLWVECSWTQPDLRSITWTGRSIT